MYIVTNTIMKNHAREFRRQSAAKSNLGLKIRLPGSPRNTRNLLATKRFFVFQGDAGAPNEKFPCSQGSSRQVVHGHRPSGMGSHSARESGACRGWAKFLLLAPGLPKVHSQPLS
jgi:hypothetical protein